jgi:hypothetical protein
VVGGECEIKDDGSVECKEPTITASSTPYICNLPFRQAAKLEVRVQEEGGRGWKQEHHMTCQQADALRKQAWLKYGTAAD